MDPKKNPLKPPKYQQSLSIPKTTYELLRRQAEQQSRSICKHVLYLIQKEEIYLQRQKLALDKFEKQHGPWEDFA